MKTIEEFYNEIMASEELKEKLAEASEEQKLDEFLRENGVDCDKEQFKEYAFAKAKEDGALTEEQLEYIAAGKDTGKVEYSVVGNKWNSDGNTIQWKDTGTGEVYHYECPTCNKWLYKDWVRWYCPECGEGFYWNIGKYKKCDVKGK